MVFWLVTLSKLFVLKQLYKSCALAAEAPQPCPNFIELLGRKILLNNFLLSRNYTSHKLFMRHSSLAGNLILVTNILLGLAACSTKLGHI